MGCVAHSIPRLKFVAGLDCRLELSDDIRIPVTEMRLERRDGIEAEQAFVHVDVDDLRAAVHLLLRDRNALCVTTAGELLDAVGAAGEHLLSPRRGPDHPRDALPETVRRVLDAVPVRSPAGEASIARTAGVSALVVQQVLPPLLVAGLVERRDGGWRLTALGAGRPAAVAVR